LLSSIQDPSGFFLNVEPTLELGTIGDFALSSIITLAGGIEKIKTGELFRDFVENEPISAEEEICDVEESWGDQVSNAFDEAQNFTDDKVDLGGGFSVGVFLDKDDDVKSVLFRVGSPQMFVFGVPLVPASTKIEVQWFKGSEMERRRGSILRVEEVKGSGVYVENCPTTVEGCQVWKPYKKMNTDTGVDDWNDQVEICEDRLFDVEDYNRYLVAQVANPIDQAFGDPPLLLNEDNAPDVWYVNPQFDLALLPDSGVTLVHSDLSAWIFGPLVTLDSLSLSIVVNTIKPGKSALVLFYSVNSCVQYKVSTTSLLCLTLVCFY